jgi:hypothetical protein
VELLSSSGPRREDLSKSFAHSHLAESSPMSRARIITTSPEAVYELTNLLRKRGYEVETVAPGASDLAPADLEFQVESCTVEDAMRRVGMQSDSEEMSVFLSADALSLSEGTALKKVPVGVIHTVQALPATGTEGVCVPVAPVQRPILVPAPPNEQPTTQGGAVLLEFPAVVTATNSGEFAAEAESEAIADDPPPPEAEFIVSEFKEPEGIEGYPAEAVVTHNLQAQREVNLLLARLVAAARAFEANAGSFRMHAVEKLRGGRNAIRTFRFRQRNEEALKIAGRIVIVIAVIWTFSFTVGWLRARSPRRGPESPNLSTMNPVSRIVAPTPIRMEIVAAGGVSTMQTASSKPQGKKIIRQGDGVIEEEILSADVTVRHFRPAPALGATHQISRSVGTPHVPRLTARSEGDKTPVVRRYSDLQ